MQLQTVIICSTQLFVLAAATLTSTPTVACPGDTVIFTCTLPGSLIRWKVTPPTVQGPSFRLTLIFTGSENFAVTEGNPAFRGVLTDSSGGMLTATLTSLSEASIVEGTMVLCEGASSQEGPLTITVADSPSPPLNPRVSSSAQNQLSSSIITLEWDPPSSTGGVSVSYVLIISLKPLSGSPVTVETTSAQITVSYNTPYNVTIRADNCAGMSNDVMMMILPIVTCPSNPIPANRVTINGAPPPLSLVGSTLSFTCNGETVPATCESDGRWSPDPTTYICPSDVTCGFPVAPSRGSVDVKGRTSPFSIDSVVKLYCDKGLFPAGDMSSTCENVGGVGTWKPDTNITCRVMPVNCSLPKKPSNGTVVNYERLNETVSEGTVLTYKCDNGLSLAGPNTITCTNAGVWSIEPEAIVCVLEYDISTTLSTGAAIVISMIITFIATLATGFLTGLLVMHLCSRKKAAEGQANVGPTVPAGPVYEEVSPKMEIKLKSNQAYEQSTSVYV
ncbi:sushi, von Willebrand factor type A, EGF and pentraxin domain-containing protein 1-like [Halichondria panicea]|uniref:sushi, von Willebrand factor type A, EGF and pentraxin domain-containing protein 1-like n=1 Tax=Halichondria panicea TaxID=6063 RepID=UPI00312B6A9A